MKLNGGLLWLAGVVVIAFSLLVWQGVIDQSTYLTVVLLVLGYYFGNTRAFIKNSRESSEK